MISCMSISYRLKIAVFKHMCYDHLAVIGCDNNESAQSGKEGNFHEVSSNHRLPGKGRC